MPTEIKICGLSDEESVDVALAAGADYLGFVFFAKSPRNVALHRARQLAARARGNTALVALTVDAEDGLLRAIVEALRPDFLQLHGRESSDQVAAVRARTGVAVMKAAGVGDRGDLAGLSEFAADRLILDAKPPREATRPGGNGVAFDWAILEGFAPATPWLLSGGLNPANVAQAISVTGAPGVDVSSGVESSPGRKDPALIQQFVAAVRAMERPSHRLAG